MCDEDFLSNKDKIWVRYCEDRVKAKITSINTYTDSKKEEE
jgi:hypothetical protein